MSVPPRSEIPIDTSLLNEGNKDHLDLLKIAHTDITTAIPDEILKQALLQPPFVPIPGALNLRDLGLIPDAKIKPGLLFRSGSLGTLPASSVQLLKSQLNLHVIYDFRTQKERDMHPDPNVPGVEAVWVPFTQPPKRAVPKDFHGDGGVKGYSMMYDDTLKVYAQSYKTILTFVRDHPDHAILYHCASK